MRLWATGPIKLVQGWHLELGRKFHIREKWEGIVVHEVFHLTSSSNHLLHFVHSFVDLLLILHSWLIMISLVLLLITLQILKLLHHTIHSSWVFMGSSIFRCSPSSAIVLGASGFLWLEMSCKSKMGLWCSGSGVSSMLKGFSIVMGVRSLELELLAWVLGLGSLCSLPSDPYLTSLWLMKLFDTVAKYFL